MYHHEDRACCNQTALRISYNKWSDTGFNHAMSEIWQSNNCSPAASLAIMVETYQSFVIHTFRAILLIIFKSKRERETKNDTHCLRVERWHYSLVIGGFSYISYHPMITIWVITTRNSGTEYLDSFHDDTNKLF